MTTKPLAGVTEEAEGHAPKLAAATEAPSTVPDTKNAGKTSTSREDRGPTPPTNGTLGQEPAAPDPLLVADERGQEETAVVTAAARQTTTTLAKTKMSEVISEEHAAGGIEALARTGTVASPTSTAVAATEGTAAGEMVPGIAARVKGRATVGEMLEPWTRKTTVPVVTGPVSPLTAGAAIAENGPVIGLEAVTAMMAGKA
ncbi:unnamed protein product [Ectocarpus sp. CCAP 1310/34]|nr:unnamed protein product [Ectocarpus sp. CCAP 1310/34]